jgi:hypothetical protein
LTEAQQLVEKVCALEAVVVELMALVKGDHVESKIGAHPGRH